MKISIAFVMALMIFSVNAHAGFFSSLKSALTGTNNSPATSTAVNALSDSQVVAGLKAALSKGVSNAIVSLGHNDGFLTNLNVRIPLPDRLQKVDDILRAAGQSKMANDFLASMNHAAEKAVPVAAGVFGEAISQMNISDAKGILTGTNDAATEFFERTTRTNLFVKFYPVVQNATAQVGVTQNYKTMMNKFSSVNSLGGLFGKNNLVNLNAQDIDAYVTNKALDGLFKMVAAEEENIRAHPLARTSDLLQQVFGAVTK